MAAPKYVKDQPAGFKNHISKIAIVGLTFQWAGGSIGREIVAPLVADGKIQVTAISRLESTNKFPEAVVVKRASYNDADGLAKALAGQELLIISLPPGSPTETSRQLIDAAAAAGVQYIVPNEYSCADMQERQDVGKDIFVGVGILETRKYIASKGMTWIGYICGFWYDYSLGSGPWYYGFDLEKRKVTFFGQGTQKIYTSSLDYAGLGLARALELPLLPQDASDKTLTLSRYFNDIIKVGAFDLSQRDMFAAMLKASNTQESDWTIDHEDEQERRKRGFEILQTGDRTGFGMLMYTRIFYPGDEAGHYAGPDGLDNERLGMPKADLQKESLKAIEMSKRGGLYAGRNITRST